MIVRKTRLKAIAAAKTLLSRTGYQVVRRTAWLARSRAEVEQIVYLFDRLENPGLPDRPRRLDLLSRLRGTTTSEALWILSCLHRALRLDRPGAVCEFGVAQGCTSALLANELLDGNRELWLYDSFAGLPAPTAEDHLIHDVCELGQMDAYAGAMAFDQSLVRQRLREVGFPASRTKVVKGFFTNDDSTPGPERICFAYVDFDLYRPIRDALDFLAHRLSVGGSVIVDDYGYFSTGAQKAVDEFLVRNPTFRKTVPPREYGHFCVLDRAADG